MRDRIWYEMIQAKHRGIYCKFYLSQQREVNKWFNVFILLFSASGVLGWSFWKDLPLATSFIVAAMSLIKLIGTEMLPNDKVFEKSEKIIDFYFEYYNRLENLWYDHYNYNIDDDEAKTQFYEIVKSEKDINKVVNEVIRKANAKIHTRSENETTTYFNNIFK
ncbi:hypothetical protein PQ459_10300 [Chryseobacterium sp. KACC 21268]|nr:hypothetical protein PQ459_10300 [Chryseobacterium sp. KACC 21268]